jgi:hypothetical protein
MRIRLAASCFAFALGISLALPPVEASARGDGFAGRAGVRAGGVRPHTFVRPINPHLTRPFHNRGNFGFGLPPYYGYGDDYYGDYYDAAEASGHSPLEYATVGVTARVQISRTLVEPTNLC